MNSAAVRSIRLLGCTSHASPIRTVQRTDASCLSLLHSLLCSCCSCTCTIVNSEYKERRCAYQRRTTLLDALVARLTFISARAFSCNPRRRSNFALDAFYCPPEAKSGKSRPAARGAPRVRRASLGPVKGRKMEAKASIAGLSQAIVSSPCI